MAMDVQGFLDDRLVADCGYGCAAYSRCQLGRVVAGHW